VPFLTASFTNFRNIADGTIDLLSREVYFVGENGQGKSNLLESLYLSAYGTSFRTRVDSELIKEGQDAFSIRTLFKDHKDHTNAIGITVKDNRKKIEKNGKQVLDRKELVNTIPCVLFSHDDLDFAVGSPERRRFFIDQSLSMYDNAYIDIMREYKKILKTRNTLLKEKRTDLLDVLDAQLAESGVDVSKKRKHAIVLFNRVFSRLYEEVSGIDHVELDYSPSWKTESADEVLSVLAEKRSLDISMCTSMSGPHRDRIRFVRNKKAFIPTASTGQRRLLSLLLRTAQATFFTELTGRLPVLLMDDVLLELDPDKRQRFNSLLPEYDQLFCTFLPGEPFERYKKSGTRVYHISQGGWNEQ
jgi:DNA replication and repair protein RecF